MFEKFELPKEEPGEDKFYYNVVDLRPEKEKTEIPVLVAPGWSNVPKTFENVFNAINENERRVLSLAHGRIKESVPLNNKEFAAIELQKALALIDILDKKGIVKADAIGYSEGGINLSMAAVLFPERFRNIIYVDPAGMIGRDSTISLIRRFATEIGKGVIVSIKNEAARKPMGTILKDLIRHIVKAPMLSLEEIKTIANSDITDMIKTIKSNNVGISIVSGADDLVFPINKMLQQSTNVNIDAFYTVRGGHAEMITNPEQYVAIIEHALTALENKFNKSSIS